MKLTLDALRKQKRGVEVTLRTPYGIVCGQYQTIIPPNYDSADRRQHHEKIVVRIEDTVQYVKVRDLCDDGGIVIDGRKAVA